MLPCVFKFMVCTLRVKYTVMGLSQATWCFWSLPWRAGFRNAFSHDVAPSLVIQYEIACSASFYATCLANDGNSSYSGSVSCQYSSERVTTLVFSLFNPFIILLIVGLIQLPLLLIITVLIISLKSINSLYII